MKLAFIGGGNMAGALIGGLLSRGLVPPQRVVVVETSPERRAQLVRDFGVQVREAIDDAVAAAPLLVLAVKPQDLEGVCTQLGARGMHGIALSIAAGATTARISRWLGHERVVRAMPNTPALVGQGITGLYARAGVEPAGRASATALLEAVGTAVWFEDEGMLDAVTAISGSGPAYVFRFIEALQQAAAGMGMGEAVARQFAVQTFLGASTLAARSVEPVGVLRERVTSKGGTTAAALARLQADGVGDSIVAAAQAALVRSRELGAGQGAVRGGSPGAGAGPGPATDAQKR